MPSPTRLFDDKNGLGIATLVGHGQPLHAGAAAVDIAPVGIAPVLTLAAASPHGSG